ncbi:MFS-type efflux pump MSMEG_3705-like [Littorina saxatilis]|uniref:Major facilitator superfamily (MFS) profile domain-containing protein n=1 Tax=Littorina saxatilis TaxID=31220 RepID=A0AAN9AYB6_9CAEN
MQTAMERQDAMRRQGYRSASGDFSGEESEGDVLAPLLRARGDHRNLYNKVEEDNRRWYQWVCSYASYVLLLMLLTYLLNQLDRYMLAITSQPLAREVHFGDKACAINETLPDNVTARAVCNATAEASCVLSKDCTWDYNGQGLEYQILAGPVFILVYTFAGIFISFAADMYNRKNLLAACLIFWSVATVLTGLVKEYWQLVLLRFLLGFGEAGCTPFAVSILTDYFPSKLRGLVIGIYNLGIYSGYSMSYALGNFITLANIMGQGWRWSFYISGIPGVVLGVLILATVSEPARRVAPGPSETSGGGQRIKDVSEMTACQKLTSTLKPFATFSVVLLCLGGSVRNAAGYVWAYNTQLYFEAMNQTPTQIAMYMSWIPLVAGSIGVILGGQVSDFVVKRMGIIARVLVLTVSQLVAAPFAAGTLYFTAPTSYIMQIPTYIIGEMWVGVALTVLVELVEPQFKTSAIAVYLFIITNIGGNVPLLVPPIQHAFEKVGSMKADALRDALYILYPGLYVGGGVLFLLTVFSLRRDKRRVSYQRITESEVTLPNDN